MVTASRCDCIHQDVTIREAIPALERGRSGENAFTNGVWLVLNDDSLVVGKLSPTDIVMNMDPSFRSQEGPQAIAHTATAGLSPALLKSLTENTTSWTRSFGQACQDVLNLQVKNCMRPPRNKECVMESDTLEEAIHKLTSGRLQSLLVTSGNNLIGILRLTDVIHQLTLVCADRRMETGKHGN